jgi:hypothetical protein
VNEVAGIPKPICVVIDTNIWRSDLLLRSPVGASLVYTLSRQGCFIGLPEVVEEELSQQIVAMGLEAGKTLEKEHRKLAALTDSVFTAVIPNQHDLEEAVTARLAKLSPILVRIPFTLDHAKAALRMVARKLPPNGENRQQFKDSAIWQAVLTLTRGYAVHLVTHDRAFFAEPSDLSKGLAPNLKEDCRKVNGTVVVSCDLGTCLRTIRDDAPPLDESRLVSLLEEKVAEQVQTEAARRRFKVGERLETKTIAFSTARLDQLAVDFMFIYRCQLDPSERKTHARINFVGTAHGSCYYHTASNTVSDHFFDCVSFDWEYADGGRGHDARSYSFSDADSPLRDVNTSLRMLRDPTSVSAPPTAPAGSSEASPG